LPGGVLDGGAGRAEQPHCSAGVNAADLGDHGSPDEPTEESLQLVLVDGHWPEDLGDGEWAVGVCVDGAERRGDAGVGADDRVGGASNDHARQGDDTAFRAASAGENDGSAGGEHAELSPWKRDG